jgi:hypothetical protein
MLTLFCDIITLVLATLLRACSPQSLNRTKNNNVVLCFLARYPLSIAFPAVSPSPVLPMPYLPQVSSCANNTTDKCQVPFLTLVCNHTHTYTRALANRASFVSSFNCSVYLLYSPLPASIRQRGRERERKKKEIGLGPPGSPAHRRTIRMDE